MTLIIGFKCDEGIALVSDTKVMDMDTGESIYQSKILTPINNVPFIVGAAGYTHLFNEFNRKLPEKSTESVHRIRIQNVNELMKTGLSRNESISYLYSRESVVQTQQQELEEHKETKPQSNTIIADIHLPYTYSAEKFLDDCKKLLKEITADFEEEDEPIDVLVGLKRPEREQPEIHYIDSKGNESEIDEYTAIGSGSPYVKMFLDRIYDKKKNMFELITEAFRIITYTELVAKENTVGYNDQHPPEALVILNDGRFGRMYFKNENQILANLKDESKNFEKIIQHRVGTLEWDAPQ